MSDKKNSLLYRHDEKADTEMTILCLEFTTTSKTRKHRVKVKILRPNAEAAIWFCAEKYIRIGHAHI